jgi:4-amino-4-deoxy-L-arabinose transferase-like glycosyltransferase
MPVLLILVVLSLLAELGMRKPIPADEPRFVPSAWAMVESGEWLLPCRGTELYAEKLPVFLWAQTASCLLVRDWQVAFLLPSPLAVLLTLWLSDDPIDPD